MTDLPVLSLVVFTPLIGVALILLVPGDNHRLIRWIALLAALASLAFSLNLLGYRPDGAEFQFREDVSWISAFGMRYTLGVDGLSVVLVLLTTVLSVVSIFYSWDPIQTRVKEYYATMLLLMIGMLGVFVSLDLFLFYVFWELSLIPMYLVIGIWGGPRRIYATVKFVIYTLVGSLLMLVAILAVAIAYASAGHPFTFSYETLRGFGYTDSLQALAFVAFFLAFAIKVPMWPFHTWLPDAHTEAPTVGSVLLAGILLKMGTYGFIRIALPVLPDAAREWAPWIGGLAAIAIVYAALACLAQRDLKRLIAFSSVGHMGFVMLAIATLTPIGINAAIFGMVAHGVITGMLFFCVGSIYDRYHTREIAELGGGLMQKLPYLGGVFAFVAIASLGLPGLAGFWGEVMALLSSYQPAQALNTALFRVFMVAGGVGTILTAGYFLWMLQRVNMGTLPERWRESALPDVLTVEWVSWLPLLLAIVALGVFPRLILGVTDGAVSGLMRLFGG
jgi:NADH-quinone oxidoreductase subunit M